MYGTGYEIVPFSIQTTKSLLAHFLVFFVRTKMYGADDLDAFGAVLDATWAFPTHAGGGSDAQEE